MGKLIMHNLVNILKKKFVNNRYNMLSRKNLSVKPDPREPRLKRTANELSLACPAVLLKRAETGLPLAWPSGLHRWSPGCLQPGLESLV
jgi:hypothetical protein